LERELVDWLAPGSYLVISASEQLTLDPLAAQPGRSERASNASQPNTRSTTR
jgi:hypothetical protein